MNKFQNSFVALAAVVCMAGAHADTLYTNTASGELASPGSVVDTFNAGAGAGLVTFQIQGYNTLDGDNYYIDIFSLTVNGVEVFSGTWDLGGGGSDRVLTSPTGSTVNHSGSVVDLSIPVTFLAGSNTVSFSYDSPYSFEGTTRAGPQGLGDEGWGLNSATITGNSVAAVPEPETYALMLAGLGVMGFVARRRAKR